MSELKKPLLKQAFPDLTDDLISKLERIATLKTYPTGTVLCHEHAHENIFYIIQNGEVAFSKLMGTDDHILRLGGAGEFFGEMALLDDRAGRSATVKTTKTTTVLEIERGELATLVQESPLLVLRMARIIVQRMRENDRQALVELYAQKREVENAYQALQRYENQRTEFLYTMSHELRTPLTSITGYMQLIRAGHMQGAGLKMSLEKMGEGLDRLVSLINDLFFLQEMDAVEPRFRTVNVIEVLNEVADKLRNRAAHSQVELLVELDDSLPTITAELDGLVRAFTHLVDNAIKFSPDGGTVNIRAKQQREQMVISVQDHGVGIAPEFMPHLFEKFQRDEVYEGHLFDGTGLGLPIVKRIIDMHAGNIRVESERGKGSTFHITLPLDARRATQEISIDDAWVDLTE